MTDLTRLDAYGLNVIYQLAYRKLHSTETALIHGHKDIAIASHQKRSVIFFLLDRSFRGIWYCGSLYLKILSRLSRRFGIGGTTLEWFQSYLVCKYQWINLRASCSVVWCTPRVGPWPSFILKVHPSTKWYRRFVSMKVLLLCGWHTQLYETFETSSLNDMDLSKFRLEACVREIDTWMLQNKLN